MRLNNVASIDSDKTMKLAPFLTLPILIFFIQSAQCQDVAYFEKTYNSKLHDIRNLSEYSDPDEYYSEIAKQLGIHKLAIEKTADKEGWVLADIAAMVKRSDNIWRIVLFQKRKARKEAEPEPKEFDLRWVDINDKKEIVYYGKADPAER